MAGTAQVIEPEKHTYSQILKSSALIGGATAANLLVRIVRTKAMAMLIGPAGVGLLGVYGSISDLSQSIAGLGVNNSGVRQIAEAVGSGETDWIARTVYVLRRASILLGALGAAALVALSKPISSLTFGTPEHAGSVALLSLAVLFSLVSAGQGALIQGMRRISDLATMGVLGAVLGAAVSIPVVYFLRENGVVPALVVAAGITLVTSWWYSRKVRIRPAALKASQIKHEAGSLLRLGLAFMASGLMMMGSAYLIRVTILRKLGFEAAGYYQAAWTLGGLYVGFILQAMGADFYPRLTAAAKNNPLCNRLVNEQARVGLLLAGPGVMATLTFAPVVIVLFYTAKFIAAVEILRWLCLGITLRVIAWPMGFVVLAKGKQSLFFWSEILWTTVYLGLAWFFISEYGLKGAGIAFFGSYISHGLIVYVIVRRLSGFRWSTENQRTGLMFLSAIALVFCGFYVMPLAWAVGAGTVAVLVSAVYSVKTLVRLVGTDRLPRPLRSLFAGFGSCPEGSEGAS
jgi:antigen flippase